MKKLFLSIILSIITITNISAFTIVKETNTKMPWETSEHWQQDIVDDYVRVVEKYQKKGYNYVMTHSADVVRSESYQYNSYTKTMSPRYSRPKAVFYLAFFEDYNDFFKYAFIYKVINPTYATKVDYKMFFKKNVIYIGGEDGTE